MQLTSLTVDNFKNIAAASLHFSPKTNCFLGNNGMGKSNLLDVIHYMSFVKSFTGVPDQMVIRRGEDFTMVRARYMRGDTPEELQLGMTRGKRKSFKRSGKEYDRLSSHIGLFPLVMVAPQDIDLIRGLPETRRRWLDMVISQGDHQYLDRLIRYNNALEQRNRLLRDGSVDHTLYQVVEMQMEMAATALSATRRSLTNRLSGMFGRFYKAIAGENAEDVAISYIGWDDTEPSLIKQFDANRRHDEAVRHTTAGPHRDDLLLTIDSMEARRTGSQGQCKTITLALRLAQYRFLAEATGHKPLLLLDDIFDKLDATRVERIMELVTSDEFGQIFITDTNRKHLDEIVRRSNGDFCMWNVDNGRFTTLEA